MQEHDFAAHVIRTETFPIYSAHKIKQSSPDLIHVVIEGDGYAWIDRFTPSDNPTPKKPVGLYIAERAAQKSVVYMGRPCQYVRSDLCRPVYWTSSRFAPEVLDAFENALDRLKDMYGNTKFHLTGFSGGAYIAFALAAHRDDISSVTTVAGLMDPYEWTLHHDVSALKTPWDTQDLIKETEHVSFQHFCGSKDTIIPCSLLYDFVKKAESLGRNGHHVSVIEGETHQSLWKALPKE